MKDIKNISFIFGLLLLFAGMIAIQSCNNEDNYPMPEIVNVRPTSADSTITAADFGLTVAIQGSGLASTQEIWFNSVQAAFNPTFVTDNNIIVSIPGDFPEEITNTIKVVTKGGTVEFPFTVIVPPPAIVSITNEFPADGETVTIKGSVFYNVASVMFPGGGEGEIIEYDPNKIIVKVPSGTTSGKFSVVASAGTTESPFGLKDRTGMICDYDALNKFENWGKESVIVNASDNPTDPMVVDGNYIKMQSSIDVPKDVWWVDQTATPHSGIVMPDFPDGDPAGNYALKFEYFSVGVFNEGHVQLQFSWGPDYWFEPYKGMTGEDFKSIQWQTAIIPLNQFAGVVTYGDLKTKDFLLLLLRTPGAADPIVGFDMNFDNLRIVKIK